MMLLVMVALLGAAVLHAAPKLVDAHVHHNGDPKFLERLVAKLETADGLAFVLTKPQHMAQVKQAMTKHPDRIVSFGDVKLDDPKVLELIDAFH